MHVIFLIKNFKLSKCGISDYINISSKYFDKQKIKNSIIFSNYLNINKKNFTYINWNVFKILKEIKKITGKKIFFFQFSPFLQSKSGFSLELLIIFFFLRFFYKETKVVINFHETANSFNAKPKYLLLYLAHIFQVLLLFLLSNKVYYTNKIFLNRFRFFKNSKSLHREIFSNIQNVYCYKNVSKCLTLFLSHYNYKNFNRVFNLVKKYNLRNKDKLYLNFIGNSNIENNIKTKKLLKKFFLLIYSKFFTGLNNKKFSEVLNKSYFTIATRTGFMEENSGLHKASIVHDHYILQINNNLDFKINNKVINIYKTFHFNKIINRLFSKKKNLKKKFNSDHITLKNFLDDFYYLLKN